ncbi:MAG TPA: ATP-binding protein [Geminicoccaceae bacterium]
MATAARPPFVGRRAELAQFRGALHACREIGTGQTVVVRGEAGIGKTRLVEEFQALAQAEGFACHSALVLDFGGGIGQDAIRTLVGASST